MKEQAWKPAEKFNMGASSSTLNDFADVAKEDAGICDAGWFAAGQDSLSARLKVLLFSLLDLCLMALL